MTLSVLLSFRLLREIVMEYDSIDVFLSSSFLVHQPPRFRDHSCSLEPESIPDPHTCGVADVDEVEDGTSVAEKGCEVKIGSSEC